MKSVVFGMLLVMAGMAMALVFVSDSSRHAAARVYVPQMETLRSSQ